MNPLDISLKGIDHQGNEESYTLRSLLGKPLVLYFYPKDNTSGCTQEACDFRDNFNRLTSYATVVGVSPDSITSHKKFREQHELNFTLLSDPDHVLAETYGAWGEKSMYGKKYMGIIRSTLILNSIGEVEFAWEKVNVKGHVDAVIAKLNELYPQ